MTTYYVDTAVGNDANAGTSEGAGNAWATIDKAMNTVIAGDHVYVKASGTYNEQATIDTAGTAWSSGNYFTFEGYSSTPGDNGRVTIDAQSTRSFCIDTIQTGALYYLFKNFELVNATGNGVQFGASPDNSMWINCRFGNCGTFGFSGDNSHGFLHCKFDGNGSRPIDIDASCFFILCELTGSSLGPSQSSAGFWNCLIYELTSAVLIAPGSVIHCTIDAEGASGDVLTNVSTTAIYPGMFNILYDSTQYGVDTAALPSGPNFYGYNLINNTGFGDYNPSRSLPWYGFGDASGAPAFTDEAGNDYTLSDTSPAIDVVPTPGLL